MMMIKRRIVKFRAPKSEESGRARAKRGICAQSLARNARAHWPAERGNTSASVRPFVLFSFFSGNFNSAPAPASPIGREREPAIRAPLARSNF